MWQHFNPLLSFCQDYYVYLRLSKAMWITSKARGYGRAKSYQPDTRGLPGGYLLQLGTVSFPLLDPQRQRHYRGHETRKSKRNSQ
jgi:hypothetical protein